MFDHLTIPNHLIVTYKDVQLETVRREHPDLLEMVTPVIRADIMSVSHILLVLFLLSHSSSRFVNSYKI